MDSHIIEFFIVSYQKNNNNSISLRVHCQFKTGKFPAHPMNQQFVPGEEYTIGLKLDGDYMDVFKEMNKIGTLIGVDDYFIKTIEGIIVKNEPVDTARISWPRRADGGMDYPPPAGYFEETHRAVSSLRLRSRPGASGGIITALLKDEPVCLLETGGRKPLTASPPPG